MSFAKALKYERIKRGMTQKEFAELLGTDRSAIAHYENDRVPLPTTLKQFSDKLNVDLAKAVIDEETQREERRR